MIHSPVERGDGWKRLLGLAGLTLVVLLLIGVLRLTPETGCARDSVQSQHEPDAISGSLPDLSRLTSLRLAAFELPPVPVLNPRDAEASEKPINLAQRPTEDASKSATAAPQEQTVLATDDAALLQGNALLRVAETSEQPFMEIAWPAQADDRETLFRVLHACLGMRIGLLLSNGRVLTEDGVDRKCIQRARSLGGG